ncbi:hypothetical protein BpHYR1_036835 [Brachionus plicatilis]|uniref:Uncharacterized protein n=1 Tax=Brachionus plicatilis TaxID=10195 RepID=A0A3M7RGY8_BRAPC|nr:hypothetical protein BpHYR1_036835 [Brachionus plicatilis]
MFFKIKRFFFELLIIDKTCKSFSRLACSSNELTNFLGPKINPCEIRIYFYSLRNYKKNFTCFLNTQKVSANIRMINIGDLCSFFFINCSSLSEKLVYSNFGINSKNNVEEEEAILGFNDEDNFDENPEEVNLFDRQVQRNERYFLKDLDELNLKISIVNV